MIAFRDQVARTHPVRLLVHMHPAGKDEGVTPFSLGSARFTDLMKTQALRQALDRHGFDAAIGGARRDEEKSRAKERIFSMRAPGHRWNDRDQRPELWRIYNTRLAPGETMRIFPLSNWTELDVWEYILAEDIPVVPLYFSRPRPVIQRHNALIVIDDPDRMRFEPGEEARIEAVRFRTLGCWPLSGAIRSAADTVAGIVEDIRSSRRAERQGRLIDSDQRGSMELKKREGYF